MLKSIKSFSSKILLGALLTGVAFTMSDLPSVKIETVIAAEKETGATKYSQNVMEELRVSLGVKKHSITLDNQISSMPKVEVMDRLFVLNGMNISSVKIKKIVNDVFTIDLNAISAIGEGTLPSLYAIEIIEGVAAELKLNPASSEFKELILQMPKTTVMDTYLEYFGEEITAAESRIVINQIFGVNLDGISGLEYAKISILSKGQWVIKKDTDLIVVTSGKGDIDIKVFQTEYFTQMTGLNELPLEIQQNLINLGFTYSEKLMAYYYANPTGGSVPDAIKGQIFGAILPVLESQYSDL